MPGYTQTELDAAQEKWSLRFPPDLIAILRERRSVIADDPFDWVKTTDDKIRDVLNWPLEGFWFDVQHNNAWWPEWGEKPARPKQQLEALRAFVAAAPKLIPVFGHRCVRPSLHSGTAERSRQSGFFRVSDGRRHLWRQSERLRLPRERIHGRAGRAALAAG
jgi:hypothetical protein